MIKISLSKALRYKNRLAEKIRELQTEVLCNNSYQEDFPVQVDSAVKFGELCNTVAKLIEVKTEIARANLGIYNTIFTLAEYKGMIALLNRLNTTEGPQINSSIKRVEGDPVSFNYLTGINKEAADKFLSEYKEEIDSLQDSLDSYNAQTVITLQLSDSTTV